jgi:hypothetical protein
MRLIQLRVSGLKMTEVAERMGITYSAAHSIAERLYWKAGVRDLAELKRWAFENAMDAPLPPEAPEDLPKPKVRRTKTRIRMNRIRRTSH